MRENLLRRKQQKKQLKGYKDYDDTILYRTDPINAFENEAFIFNASFDSNGFNNDSYLDEF